MKTILIVVTDSDKQFSSLAEEYTKRLGKLTTIKKIKPIKHGSVKEIIAKETALLVDECKKYPSAHRVLLAHTWTSLLSEEFSALLYKHDTTVFIVWWPYGVDESVLLPEVHTAISFWKQTLPHGLVKVLLLEQIRRWRTIKTGKKYHY